MTDRVPGRNPFEPSLEQLPETLPIFPLSGVLLLPGGKLPLNIFEPRYLAMIFDSLAGHRMIGMVQPMQPGGYAGDGLPTEDGRPKVHKIGCAGRIVSFNETEDGRLLLALSGVCRFEIVRELDLAHGGYRRVSSLFSPYRADLDHADEQVELDRDRLMAGLAAFFRSPQPVDRLGRGEAGGRRQSRDLAVHGPALRPGREAGLARGGRLHGPRQAPGRLPGNERLRPGGRDAAETGELRLRSHATLAVIPSVARDLLLRP